VNTSERGRKLALISGPSSGIGSAARSLFLANGYRVIGLSREPDRQHEEDLALDLECFEHIENLGNQIEAAIPNSSSVVLVNNAGYGQFGAVRDLTAMHWQRQFATHVFGPIKLAAECLRLCEKHGVPLRIVAVSSVLSIVPQKMKGAYCAAKSAMNAAHDSFWFDERSSEWLHSVSIVLPGPVATNFRSNALAALNSVEEPTLSRQRERYRKMKDALAPGAKKKPFTASAELVAVKVLAAAEAKWPKPRYFVTPQTYVASILTRFMPYVFQRMLLR